MGISTPSFGPPSFRHGGASQVGIMKRGALPVVACAAVAWSGARTFVSAPIRSHGNRALPAVASLMGAAPAMADPIGDAAKKLTDAAYPLMKEVKWDSYVYNLKPGGSATASDWAKAVDKAIEMGAAMDPKLLKAGVQAHHKAIGSLTGNNLVLSKADFESINAAIGRMIASVPESKTKKAYGALMDFKDAVKANPITATAPETPAALSGKLGAIDGAAAKLSAASYPFIQSVDWSSDLYSKPLPGASPLAVTKAIDKALVMGAAMDGKLLSEAAQAHVKAIGGMDAKLVASEADFTAVVAGLGKVIASVPASKVMDTYNAFAKVVDGSVPAKLYSTVNPGDAVKAYDSLITFTNTVKAAQR